MLNSLLESRGFTVAGRYPDSIGVGSLPLLPKSYLDTGTLNRQFTPQPGLLGIDASLSSPFQMVCSVEPVKPPQEGDVNELLIMDASEWRDLLKARGPDLAVMAVDIKKDLIPALKKLGIKGKASMRVINGKEYVVISGPAGLRKILTGTKYLPSHPKVVDLVIGKGRIGKSALKSTGLGIVLVVAVDVLEAVLTEDEWLSRELGLTILVDIGKAALAALATTIVVAGVATVAPVVVSTIAGAIAVGIIVGFVVGFAVDAIFPTEKIVGAMEDKINDLLQSPAQNMSPADRNTLMCIWPHEQIPFPY